MRRFGAALALLALLPAPASRADVLANVRARGSVRVGVSEGVPWMMRDAGDAPMGFTVDLAERLASDLGVALELITLPHAELVPAVAAGRVDVASGLSITVQRALEVDFTSSLATSQIEVVAHLDPDGARFGLDALDREQVKIAFEAGTLFEDLARVRFPNAVLAPAASEADARAALLEGQVQALIAAKPLPELLARGSPETLFQPADAALYTTAEGLAVRRGETAWLRVLDAWIVEQKASGFLARTRAYWFDDTEWVGRLAKLLRETVQEPPARN